MAMPTIHCATRQLELRRVGAPQRFVVPALADGGDMVRAESTPPGLPQLARPHGPRIVAQDVERRVGKRVGGGKRASSRPRLRHDVEHAAAVPACDDRHTAHERFGGGKAESLTGGRKVQDRKSTRLNSSHSQISYAVFCLKKKK